MAIQIITILTWIEAGQIYILGLISICSHKFVQKEKEKFAKQFPKSNDANSIPDSSIQTASCEEIGEYK